MTRRIRLRIAYDGTGYHGWQIQENALSVEAVVIEAIQKLTGEQINLIGASRTDAGVHALGNVAVFDTESRIPADKFSYALNQWLPDDIRVMGSDEVSCEFHPRYTESKKTYCYTIENERINQPLLRNQAYFVYQDLDVEKMKSAAKHFLGEHDFKGFCSTGSQVKTTVRTIYAITVMQEKELIRIEITGNGFLYNMVRIIAGTLIEVGKGLKNPDELSDVIASGDRRQAGATAPARGLCLMKIEYKDE